MDQNDQQAIGGLFDKLAQAERAAPARDAGAESFIARRIGEQPAAPYYMAQTIVIQQAALEQAQARIEDLESRPQGGGGFLSSLFGGGQPARSAQHAAPQGPASAAMQRQAMGGGGGGFLAGAAQTAMGVAGGVLLGNAIAGMFAGEAEAAEAPAEDEGTEEDSFADMGEDLDI